LFHLLACAPSDVDFAASDMVQVQAAFAWLKAEVNRVSNFCFTAILAPKAAS